MNRGFIRVNLCACPGKSAHHEFNDLHADDTIEMRNSGW